MHGGPQEMCLPEHEHPEVQIGVHFVSVQRHGKTPVANDSPAYFSLIPSGKPHAGGWADGSEVVVTLLPKLQVEYAAGELLRSSCSEIVGTSCAVDPIILSMGTTLRNEFLGGGLEDPLFVEAVGTVLTGHVVRHWSSRPSQRSMKGQLSPYQLRRTLDAIESWMPSGIRVSALADQLGMGTHQFTRLFRQTAALPGGRGHCARIVTPQGGRWRSTHSSAALVGGRGQRHRRPRRRPWPVAKA